MPFACADGTCMFCDNGLQVSHIYGSFFGMGGEAGGALAKAVRILPPRGGVLVWDMSVCQVRPASALPIGFPFSMMLESTRISGYPGRANCVRGLISSSPNLRSLYALPADRQSYELVPAR